MTGLHMYNFGLILAGPLRVDRETPALAKYARELTFVAVCDEPKKRSPRVKALGSLTSRLHSLFHPSQKRKVREFRHQVEKAKTLITSLDQLTSLTIVWFSDPGPYSPFYQSHIVDNLTRTLAAGWSTFGSTISSLSLDITFDVFPILFPQGLDAFRLPQLEVLKLSIQEHQRANDLSIIHSLVAPFIRRHADTLKRLGILSWFSTNHKAFYTSIGHLPHLRELQLKENINDRNAHAQSLREFLLLHTSTLEVLDWTLMTETGWPTAELPEDNYTQAPFDVHLPKLKVLRLYFLGVWMNLLKDFRDLVRYIGQHTQTLTSLSLVGRVLSISEFHTLINSIGTPQLQTLKLSLSYLTSLVFTALSTRLPNLETLSLEYERLYADITRLPPWNPPFMISEDAFVLLRIRDQFIGEVQGLPLEEWRLKTLSLSWQIFYSGSWVGPMDFVNKAILKCIPSVQYINGKYREDFLGPESEAE